MGVYENLGIRPVINGWGTVTVIGGSLMAPEVLEAMSEAARSFVDLRELHSRAGESIARMLRVPAACVTSSASAGLTVAAAACMGRDDQGVVAQLPDTTGLKDECLVLASHRNRYDQAVRVSGMKLRDIGGPTGAAVTEADIVAAVTKSTAMFLYTAESAAAPGSLPLADVAHALAPFDIPVVVDAAAELPPLENVTGLLDDGADLLVLSGGKEIRGPQSSGLILGSEKLIAWCFAHCFPNHGIGRGMKIDKETIAGLVTALELFVHRDERAELARWDAMASQLVRAFDDVDGFTARRGFPTEPGLQPAIIPRAYLRPSHCPAEELRGRLREWDPRVWVGVEGDEIAINPQCLADIEIPIVIRAVIEAHS